MTDWSVDSDVRRFGSRSMRCLITAPAGVRTAYPVENDAGADVSVTPDTGYILTVYVNTGALPVNADIRLAVFAEGSLVDELVATYIDASESITRNTIGKGDENWQRLILRFATIEHTRVRPTVVYGPAGATVGDTFWIDAMQMEESPIPTPWRPGMVGNAAVLDVNGLLIDGQQGGLLRLRDAAVPTSRQASLLDVLDAIYPSVMRQERDTDQGGIVAGTVTTIAFNNLVRQDDERDDLAINTPSGGQVTINRAGWYRFEGGVLWSADNTGRREVFLRRNSNTVIGQTSVGAGFSATIAYYQSLVTTLYCAVGDVLRVDVRHSASVNLQVLASQGTYISVCRVRT
jgi:hypothetical protein